MIEYFIRRLLLLAAALVVACSRAPVHGTPPDSQSRYENAALADVGIAEYFASSPDVIAGDAFPRSQDTSAAVGTFVIRDSRGHTSTIDATGSGLAIDPGSHVIAGVRQRNGHDTLAYGRAAFLVFSGDSAYRYTSPGKPKLVPLTADLRCAARISACYERYLAEHGVKATAERNAFAHAAVDDPLLPILYFAAHRRGLVSRFPTMRCKAAAWRCASSEAYRKLLHFSPDV